MSTQQKLQTVLLAASIGFVLVASLVFWLPKKWPIWLRPIIAALVGGGVMLGLALYLLNK